MLFLGVAKWDEKLEPAARGGRGGAGAAAGAAGDQPSTVEIWHAKDIIVMPKQKIDAASDRRRSLLAAWNLDSGTLVTLAKDLASEQVTPIRRTSARLRRRVVEVRDEPHDRPAGGGPLARRSRDGRTHAAPREHQRPLRPGGTRRQVPAVHRGRPVPGRSTWRRAPITNITKAVPTSFIDKESDQTSPQKPPFGVAGWTKDDGAVLLNDKYDVWLVPSDGSKAERLTSGAAEQVGTASSAWIPTRSRIDLGKPVYLSLFGEWTKKSGYARRDPTGTVTRLVWLDRSVDDAGEGEERGRVRLPGAGLRRPRWTCIVGAADLKNPKQVTRTERVPVRLRVGPQRAARLQDADRAPPAGLAALPGRLRGRPEVPDDRLQLRAAVAERPPLRGAVGPRVLQHQRLHQPRLLRPPARHRLHAEEAGAVGHRVRDGRRQQGDPDGRRRSEAHRRRRPLDGRLQHEHPGDAHERDLRRGGRRRPDDRPGQLLRRPPLELGDCRDRSHRDGAGADGGAGLRGPRRTTSTTRPYSTRTT